MSFSDGTLNKEKAIETIANSSKPCKYTYGLKSKGSTAHLINISAKDAVNKIVNGSLIDITERKEYFEINEYHANDMC